MVFNSGMFYGFLIQGDLCKALNYAKQFSSERTRLDRYEKLFEKQQYIVYPVCREAQNILRAYQQYYRAVFFTGEEPDSAVMELHCRLAEMLGYEKSVSLNFLEETIIRETFQRNGLYFMGGKTGGYHGPYVWKNTDEKIYQVELPECKQPYLVRWHQGFITRGWLDYISFGEISTGGWSNGDGTIDCIADCYDVNSEAFQISLLKHEAQHAQDLKKYPDMSQEDLEYRAKLVELIYSEERDLLADFRQEAGETGGHSRAAKRICREIPCSADIKEVQAKARALFFSSATGN